MEGYVSIRDDVLNRISEHLPELTKRFGVLTLGIFGSVARGEDDVDSDVDVLYLFEEGRGGMRDLAGLKFYLEDLFGRETDLISLKYVSPLIQKYVAADAILFGQKAALV
ncbi:MAG TPA: nucleotidyltransferase domain-containing protein [Methanocorpusculum sp.]|nr:nucleotidyltransferase domain-containing protein [Methanocorpusculum sp.]